MRIPLAACALLAAACTVMPPTPESAASLIAAERAFSAQSVATDMRSAFMAHFADDGVMVSGGWVNARATLANAPTPPVTLQWRPEFVAVARSGELGLSTGPWKRTSRKDPDAAPAHGHFASIWRRAAGGPWQVVVDLGIAHGASAAAIEEVQVAAQPEPASAGAETLAEAETRFVRASMGSGLHAAYGNAADATLRLYREGRAPLVGREAALASNALADDKWIWFADQVESARSMDFGYVRGTYAAAAESSLTLGYFLRVWRRTPEGWRIALDVTNAARPR